MPVSPSQATKHFALFPWVIKRTVSFLPYSSTEWIQPRSWAVKADSPSALNTALYQLIHVFVDLDKERPQLELLALCPLEGLFLLEHRDQGVVNWWVWSDGPEHRWGAFLQVNAVNVNWISVEHSLSEYRTQLLLLSMLDAWCINVCC